MWIPTISAIIKILTTMKRKLEDKPNRCLLLKFKGKENSLRMRLKTTKTIFRKNLPQQANVRSTISQLTTQKQSTPSGYVSHNQL